jgi:hypothetical protein
MRQILALAAIAAFVSACTLSETVDSGVAPVVAASTRDSVDLAAWKTDSVNGKAFASNPSMSAIVPFGGKAFVILQRLDSSWGNSHKSVVVVVDPVTRRTEANIVLPVANPTSYTVDGSTLYLACTGSYYDGTDGGIVALDMTARTARVIAPEANFGGVGSLAGIQISGTKGFASVTSWPKTWIVPFDLATGTVDSAIPGIDSAGATLVVGGSLWIGLAKSAAPSLVRYDISTKSLHDTIAMRLEPYDIQLASDGRLAVLETHYNKGGGMAAFDLVDVSTKKTTNVRMMSHSNWALSVRAEGMYLFDRTSAVATLYSGANPKSVLLDENVGTGSNPYDAAKFGTETWVVRFGSNSLLILK